jgi:SAM-dependent methyltransferase
MSDIHSENSEAPCEDIRALYSDLARNPGKEFGWGKGNENARALGYEARWLESLSEPVWESAAAVGNPFTLGLIRPGEVVVDLGCGAGADLCVSALLVGAAGHVIGIDLTPAMVEKARKNAALSGLGNVEARIARVEATGLPDSCADVVISNGAINLSTHKLCVFKEAFRILKPSGRLQFADMVRVGANGAATCDSWADCVAGTVGPERYLEMLRAAGFADAELVGFTAYKTSATTIGATFRAHRP